MNRTIFYELLGVKENASQAEIKKAFRKLSKKLHPDIPETGDAERYRHIKNAYEVLSDPEKRQYYDRNGRPPLEVDIDQEVSKTMNSLIGAVLNHPDCRPDVFTAILQDMISDKKRELENQIEVANNKIEKLNQMVTVKVYNQKKNKERKNLKMVVDNLINEIESQIERAEIGIKIFNACMFKSERLKDPEDFEIRSLQDPMQYIVKRSMLDLFNTTT